MKLVNGGYYGVRPDSYSVLWSLMPGILTNIKLSTHHQTHQEPHPLRLVIELKFLQHTHTLNQIVSTSELWVTCL